MSNKLGIATDKGLPDNLKSNGSDEGTKNQATNGNVIRKGGMKQS